MGQNNENNSGTQHIKVIDTEQRLYGQMRRKILKKNASDERRNRNSLHLPITT